MWVRQALLGTALLGVGACTLPTEQTMFDATKSTGNAHAQVEKSACPPEMIQFAINNASQLSTLQPGHTKQQALSVMGVPQRWDSFLLTDGRWVEVMFYRLGYDECTNSPTEINFMPLVFHNGTLMGYGQDYYNYMIAPVMASRQPTPQVQPPQYGQKVPSNAPSQSRGYGARGARVEQSPVDETNKLPGSGPRY